jgi:uracil-DNA glycosylase
MILFVGDRPSKRMKAGAKAFEGAACEKRLSEWIQQLTTQPVQNYYIVNSVLGTEDIALINLWIQMDLPIVALGDVASRRMKTARHFKLPHPSGRNRQLNSPEFIATKLAECKRWLRQQHGY